MITISKLNEEFSLYPLKATIKKVGVNTKSKIRLIQLKTGCKTIWLGLVSKGEGGTGDENR
jgi:hypothetical protein